MTKLFLLILLLSFGSLFAQTTGGIRAKFTDSRTGAVISGVEVLLSPSNKGTTSNSKGYIEIIGIDAGKYVLDIKHLGYNNIRKKINIVKGKVLELELKMDVDIRELLAVEIRDDKIVNHAYSKVVLKEAQIEQKAVRDIGDYMREIPNVSAVRKGGANLDPVIRGFKFSQLNVQVDNGLIMEGGCPNRMDPTTSHVEAGDIEAIEVIKGPFALRYGPVMGGVVNLLTTEPKPFNKFQIHVKGNMGYESNWNGQRQHISVYGGGKKVFFSFSGNNAQYGNYSDGDGNLVSSSFNKFGYNGKLGFAIAKNHTILFSYSEFYARNVEFPSLPMDERVDNTKLYSIDYKARNISKTIETIDIKAYLTNVNHTMDNYSRGFSDTVATVSHTIANRIGYRAELGLNTGKNSHLFVGTDMFRIDKDGDRTKTMLGQFPKMGKVPVKLENLWNNAVITNYGIYGEYTINKNLWEFVASTRLDFNSAYSDSISLLNMKKEDIIGISSDSTYSSFLNFSFSFGVTRKLNENMSLGFSIGRGVRSADMNERFIINLPVGFDNYEYLGNPFIKPESNNELDIVYKYNNQKLGGLEATAFYSFIQDYIGGVYLPPSVHKPLMQSVLGVKRFENLGNASLYGFELSYATPNRYKWRASITTSYTAGTLSEVGALDFDNNGNVVGQSMLTNDPLGEIPPFNLNLNLKYKLFNAKIIPSINYRFSGAQNRVSTAMQELTTPSFSLLDFSILYKHNQYFRVVGGVNNVFNISYYEHLNRRILGTNSRIYEPGRVLYINLIFNI